MRSRYGTSETFDLHRWLIDYIRAHGGGGGGGIGHGTADQFYVTNHAGTAGEWQTVGQDISYASGNVTVIGIQDNPVPTPTGSMVALVWTGTAFEWSTLSVAAIDWTVISSNETLPQAASGYYLIDSTSGTVTVQMPSAPVQGDNLVIKWYKGTNAVTVNPYPSGTKVEDPTNPGIYEGFVIPTKGDGYIWKFYNDGVSFAGFLLETIPGSFAPGADLTGNGSSTAVAQYVSSISYSVSSGGGTVNINGTNTNFAWQTAGGTSTGTAGLAIDAKNRDIKNVRTLTYDQELANGNSSTAQTINWANAQKQSTVLTGDCTFTFDAPLGPCNVIFKVTQGPSGGPYTVTWPATIVKWPGGVAPTLSTAANAVDLISFYYDGTDYFGTFALGFA